MKTRSIVFIHGMFMTSLCWEKWIPFFRTAGYACTAPNWPGRDEPPDVLRKKHPDPQLGKLTLPDVVDFHARMIANMPEMPVLIGHSMGGLAAQLLLQRGMAAACVAIDSAPPAGVFTTRWSFLKANWPMINPLVAKTTPHLMTFAQFQYAFVNNMPLPRQLAAYDRYVVPESRQVPQSSLGEAGRIDFTRPHAPLLLTAGGEDHIIPASLNKTNFAKYSDKASVTAFKEFPGRAHFVIGQDGWEEVAGYIRTWLEGLG
jgi:pimeloyl-ACP methyl ester carboxylesterase